MSRRGLIAILLISFSIKAFLLLFFWDKPLTVVDENHYQTYAKNLLDQHSFIFQLGIPTSRRPPLYPFFLWFVYFLTGGVYFNVVRILQIFLSLGSVLLTYFLGKRIFDEKAGLIAALIMALYPPFQFYPHLVLAEVLFIFLLLICIIYFLKFLKLQKGKDIFLSGLFLGLSSLTRSITYPFIVVMPFILLFCCRVTLLRRMKWIVFVILGYALVVTPWTLRNWFLFHEVVVVDTLGGFNLYLGNYEHTPFNRAWGGVDLTGEKTFYYGHEKELHDKNEAERSNWCIEMAKYFILSHKWLTFKRTIVKAANFWGLERSIIGLIVNDHYPQLNKRISLLILTPLIFLFHIGVVITAMFGICYQFSFKRVDLLFILLLILHFTALHSITFGHSRYHLPLIPLLCLFSGWTLFHLREIWQRRFSWRFASSAFVSLLLILIWVREIVFIEGERFIQIFTAS